MQTPSVVPCLRFGIIPALDRAARGPASFSVILYFLRIFGSSNLNVNAVGSCSATCGRR